MIVALLAALAPLPQDTFALSMDHAVARALAVSPAVAAASGAVHAPRGLRSETRWPFPDNPEIEYGRTRRQGGTNSVDRSWAVTQEVEIAFQWSLRGSAASELVRSAEARVADVRRLAALEARSAYAALAIAEGRAALTDSAAAFSERLATFARRQFESGEVNRLELNAAVLEAARTRSGAERARADAAAAAADLGRLLALPLDSVPRATALPPVPSLPGFPDSLLERVAFERRPDLRATTTLARSAAQSASAARRSRVPNVTIAALGGEEGGTDQLLGVALGLRIPLFHRQQARIGAAESDVAAAEALVTGTRRAVRSEVLAAGTRFTRAHAAEQRFARDVLRAATENVTLTERALTEGEVSLTDVLVLRSTAVSAQLEYLDVLRDAANAWFELAAALAAEPAELPTLLGAGR